MAKALRPPLLVAALAFVATPALAANFTYQGQLTFSARAGELCTPAAGGSHLQDYGLRTR